MCRKLSEMKGSREVGGSIDARGGGYYPLDRKLRGRKGREGVGNWKNSADWAGQGSHAHQEGPCHLLSIKRRKHFTESWRCSNNLIS